MVFVSKRLCSLAGLRCTRFLNLLSFLAYLGSLLRRRKYHPGGSGHRKPGRSCIHQEEGRAPAPEFHKRGRPSAPGDSKFSCNVKPTAAPKTMAVRVRKRHAYGFFRSKAHRLPHKWRTRGSAQLLPLFAVPVHAGTEQEPSTTRIRFCCMFGIPGEQEVP